MKNVFIVITAIMLMLFVALFTACNDENGFFSPCGCDGDSDATEGDNDSEGSEDTEDTEEADDELSESDGDTDSSEGAENSEMPGESDIEEEAFIPADCLLDAACTRIMVASHRGYHAVYPDNSLAAVRAAFELGADLAEVDVLETADEVLVLSHENDLSLITDGSGYIDQLTWDEIKDLNVNDGDPANEESMHLGRFSDALAIAREYGKMLYVDVKTGRGDLIVAVIQSDDYYKEALVRDDIENLLPMLTLDSELVVMPPVENTEQFNTVMTQADPPIVEIASISVSAELGTYINNGGVKIQQDVMFYGDTKAVYDNDYSHWKEFIDAGVMLLQTDAPKLLVPAVQQYNASGEFPASGPEEE